MKTFDLFNNREFSKEWLRLSEPEFNLDMNYLTNLKYGSLSAILMAISSYVLRSIYYDQVIILPLLTIPFLACGIAMAIREQVTKKGKYSVDYFEGFSSGIFTALVSISLFSMYITWYFSRHPAEDEFISPLMCGSAVWIADMSLSVVITVIAMQYFKGYKSNNSK